MSDDRDGDVDSEVSPDKVNDIPSIRTAPSDADLQASKPSPDTPDSPGKSRLFGREKPVHAALGGGKSADIILWRNKQISAGALTSATVIWLLFEWIEYHLLTFVCHSLILLLAMVFLWSNLSSFVNKTPLDFPEFVLPEELCRRAALAVRDKFHWAVGIFREVASGKDLKKFLYAILGLWILSAIGSWFDFLTLIYIIFVMVLTVPIFYEKHEDQVDAYAHKAKKQIERQYSQLDEKVLQKLPKVQFSKDSKQH
ncbi:PREDICTED: reticulon-like protein B5 [Ipomoea nil]|uniref:reticulon-like protein B5 n=1 Tax=Ipomoea nil TaxID=35883 RepID=UPI000900C9E4|nr:PREDICTED: reticulon-like protein B5 [Ipomoea nil]